MPELVGALAGLEPGVALWLYLRMLAGDEPAGSFLEVRHRLRQGGMGQCFHPCRRAVVLREHILSLGETTDVYISCAPRVRRQGGAGSVERSWVLWVDCDGPEAVSALRAFEPLPSFVVRSGTAENVHAYWQLRGPLPAEWARLANQKLARALGADARATDPARILRPPGTLNHKHSPPQPVVCEALEVVSYSPAAVVGHLPDAGQETPGRALDAGDVLLRVPPAIYVQALTGRELGRDGKASCPLHDDRTPSLHVYSEPERGWYCFGCQRGGTIYDLGAALWGLGTRGDDFRVLRLRLLEELAR